MAEEQTADNQFQIHKIYVKDLSFEIPGGTASFQNDWTPELNIEIHTQTKALSEKDTHEVVLSVKCTVTNSEKTAFIVEVKQAGIFQVEKMDDNTLRQTLGAFCPNLLYPYLREVVSDVVMKGGFPQLSLAPINFDALYEQQLSEANDA